MQFIMKLIGVAKNCTRQFLMHYLSKTLESQKDYISVVNKIDTVLSSYLHILESKDFLSAYTPSQV